jgi:hypothetical protein
MASSIRRSFGTSVALTTVSRIGRRRNTEYISALKQSDRVPRDCVPGLSRMSAEKVSSALKKARGIELVPAEWVFFGIAHFVMANTSRSTGSP